MNHPTDVVRMLLLSRFDPPTDSPWLLAAVGLVVGVLLAAGVAWWWRRWRRLVETERPEEDSADLTEAQPEPTVPDQPTLQRRQLESLGVLAGSLAHDLNNVLTTILGSADLARDQVREGSPLRASVDTIHLSAQRGAELCRQVLSYSEQGPPRIQTIDLAAFVEEMSPLFEATLPKKVELRRVPATGLPAVDVDLVRLRQVVLILVTRAAVAIGDRCGTVTIRAGARDCDEELLDRGLPTSTHPGEYVFLEVAGSGSEPGDDVEEAPLDPVVGELVRERGGTILVDRLPQLGSTVTILLPKSARGDEVAKDQEPREEDPTWAGRGTVLIADDESTVLHVLALMLERFGYSVVTARDGREAVEAFGERAEEIECVILDLCMPRLDGVEALREIRAIRSDVPALLASGYTEADLTTRFGEEDDCGFVQKPYTLDELRRQLQRVTRGTLWPGEITRAPIPRTPGEPSRLAP